MHYSLGMTVIDGLEKLLHVLCCSLFGESGTFPASDCFEQVHALHVVHNQVQIFSVVIGLVVRHNVRVIKTVHYLNFLLDLINAD